MTRSHFFKNCSIALCWVLGFLIIGYLIGQTTRANMDWYATLTKSPLNPPRFVFPIAWSCLYSLLAIGGALLWLDSSPKNRQTKILFASYMLVNWAWTFIFFAAHEIWAGFVWIILSDILLLATILSAWKIQKKWSALLFIPTLFWGGFAAYLNGFIALTN